MEPSNWVSRVKIRHIQKAELPVLEWEGVYTHYRRVYADAFERMSAGRSVMWVADLPGTGIIGQVFVQLICDRPDLADGFYRAYLFAFRVRPEHRSLGLGSKMLSVVEADLIRRGYARAVLNVAQVNLRARSFYERNGYTVAAPEPGRWSYPDENGKWRTEVEPAWRMEKDLVVPERKTTVMLTAH
jgi:ribosomal protein S18 acetylase RimI-like enzyme